MARRAIYKKNTQAENRLRRILKNMSVPSDMSDSFLKALMSHLLRNRGLLQTVAKKVQAAGSPTHRYRAQKILEAIRQVLEAKPNHYRASRLVLTQKLLEVEDNHAIATIMAADGAPPVAEMAPALPPLQSPSLAAQRPPSLQLCAVCMGTPVAVIFVPCKHMACFQNCAGRLLADAETLHQLAECPICRSAIWSSILPIVSGYDA